MFKLKRLKHYKTILYVCLIYSTWEGEWSWLKEILKREYSKDFIDKIWTTEKMNKQ